MDLDVNKCCVASLPFNLLRYHQVADVLNTEQTQVSSDYPVLAVKKLTVGPHMYNIAVQYYFAGKI